MSSSAPQTLSAVNQTLSDFNRFALLDPDAVIVKTGVFSRPIAATKTEFLLSAWNARVGGSAGRLDVRDVTQPCRLCGVTLSGVSDGTGSSIILLTDPSLVTQPGNPGEALAARLTQLDLLPTKVLAFSQASDNPSFDPANPGTDLDYVEKVFLPGPYGTIVRFVSLYDCAWFSPRLYTAGNGYNVGFESGDRLAQRFSAQTLLPFNKGCVSTWVIKYGESGDALVHGGYGGDGTHKGTVLYNLLPAGWSNVPDPVLPVGGRYVFRDDFMGDLSNWTVVYGAIGSVAIDSNFAWVKIAGGDSSFSANGLYSNATFTRTAGYAYVVDFNIPHGSLTDPNAEGGCNQWFGVGPTNDLTTFVHGVQFGGGTIRVYENNVSRTITGGDATHSIGTFRLRLTPQSNGSCTYEFQGQPGAILNGTAMDAYPIGGSAWYLLPVTASSSTAQTWHIGAGNYHTSWGYIGDVRVYKP